MEDKLIKLVGLIDHGGYTKAAKQLHISQPALSMAIKELETTLGKQLILRNRSGVKLTKYGEEAYATGKQIVSLRNSLEQKFNGKNNLEKLRIGLIDSVASQLLSTDYLDSVSKQLKPVLIVNSSARLLKDLTQDKLDVVFASETKDYDTRVLSSEAVGDDILACVVSSENYELYRSEYQANYLKNFITYNKESYTYDLIASDLEAKKIDFDAILSSTSPEVVRSLVLDGSGCGFLPLHEVQHHIDIGELLELDESLRVKRRINSYTPKFLEGSPEIDLLKVYLKNLLK